MEENKAQGSSLYANNHWTRTTIETLVKLENLKKPIVALIDHGLKINLNEKTRVCCIDKCTILL